MKEWVIFTLLSVPVLVLSIRSLRNPASHGFPRFFAWEGIIFLFAFNARYWFYDPLSVRQIISWLLLFGSIYPVMAGTLLLVKSGKPSSHQRKDPALFDFEKTANLVQQGIYGYIRHPLYLSLIMLTWGIFLKHVNILSLAVTAAATVLLYLTARLDEKECLQHFGNEYAEYMRKTKMFVPFLV